MAVVKPNHIPKLVRVKMLKDFKVSDRFTAKKGKYGDFAEDVAKKMIKDKAAEEIVAINSVDDIFNKKPYIEVMPEKNPTQKKQEEAENAVVKTIAEIGEIAKGSKKKTKEQKFN